MSPLQQGFGGENWGILFIALFQVLDQLNALKLDLFGGFGT